MEKTAVKEISPIETALAKENITNQVIESLKTNYLGLKINGLDDKAGFKAVEDARKHCKQLRVLAVNICKSGREEAVKTQKDWIAKEKEIVAAIEVTEDYLSAQSEAIKEEEKRILFEAAQKAKLPIRKERLMTIGVEVPEEKLLSINDEDFNALFNDLHTKVLDEQAEALRVEKQRIADEQETERKRIESEVKAEQEKLAAAEREKTRLENERLKAENESKEKALAEEKAKAKAIQNEQDAIIAANKKKADEEAAKAKAIADLQIKAEKEAKEKALAEEKAKAKAIQNEQDAIIAANKKKADEEAAKAKAIADLQIKAEKEAKEKALAEEKAKAKAIQNEQDAIIAANKKKADEEAAKAKAIADLQIKAEKEAKEKAEAELKASKLAEEKRLADIEEAKELELTKGDAEKFTDLINDLNALKTKYSFKSKKHQSIYLQVVELTDKIITYITKK